MSTRVAQRILVRGTVQGVGFRPFIYRLAIECKLTGWVLNDTQGVTIHIEGPPDALTNFARAVRNEPPPAAKVSELIIESAALEYHESFTIRNSAVGGGMPTTHISPDLPVCADCLRELRDATDRRYGYPYINCTNCGPRFSIMRALPYDRPHTTMAAWPLCDACNREYRDPANRRYHAQPVACPQCGPAYRFMITGETAATGNDALRCVVQALNAGSIIAIKGIGGYHLACDAGNERAVNALRERKFRKEKPFALMVSSIESARRIARLTALHVDLLTSSARPIVLIPAKADFPEIAPDSDDVGLMLPYTPLHALLFDAGAPDPLVLTSANRSNEPIAYEDATAMEQLAGIADRFLIGERAIQRRVDDSVVSVRRGAPLMVRRARGYAPASVAELATPAPILAVGADLKNAIAVAVGGEVFVSQHIGDLGELETNRAFEATIDDLLTMYAVDRAALIIAHDLHPQYVSTRFALTLAGARHIAIQHHEAHIAAVLLEHRRLDETVVGIALDGTGYGRDETIWGGEVLIGSVRDGFQRRPLFEPVLMPGGDAAARFPVQAAAAFLPDVDPALLERAPFNFPARFRQAQALVRAGIRSIPTTSVGRLFDAAAAVCGFTRAISFEGQAALWLEHRVRRGSVPNARSFEDVRDWKQIINKLMACREQGMSVEDLAASFHRWLARLVVETAVDAAVEYACRTVVLSGGVWQNQVLLDAVLQFMPSEYLVLWGQNIPVNDGGICVGQVGMARVLSRGDWRYNPADRVG